jgi:hypothetical protein
MVLSNIASAKGEIPRRELSDYSETVKLIIFPLSSPKASVGLAGIRLKLVSNQSIEGQ